jgi:hypothetical protein
MNGVKKISHIGIISTIFIFNRLIDALRISESLHVLVVGLLCACMCMRICVRVCMHNIK